MKKLSTFLLLGFYLIASIGFSTNVHFCGESVAEIAILTELSGKSCGCDAEEESNSCCQEKTFEYKVDTEHLGQAYADNLNVPIIPILSINEPLSKASIIDIHFTPVEKFKRGQDPPPRIYFCVYRL